MRMMNYKWLILLLLAKTGDSTTPAAVAPAKPAISQNEIFELIDMSKFEVKYSWYSIMDLSDLKLHDKWMAALKQSGKDNESWLNYHLMAISISSRKYKLAETFLDAIISAPNNAAVMKRIKDDEFILQCLHAVRRCDACEGELLPDIQSFKKKLGDNVYVGADRPIFDKYLIVSKKTKTSLPMKTGNLQETVTMLIFLKSCSHNCTITI